ncbi:hypothetical protein H6790_00930 [Candidatus Nomurabacteria bacterium]|nr:hypothetical protein [Candidatus Nomurabacteria bacterium]MCB9820493.1 hypothetical protein [Candidatus Nomurabacteria bacterium]
MGYEESFLGNLDRTLEKQRKNIFEDSNKLKQIVNKMKELFIIDKPEISSFGDIHKKDVIDSDLEKLKQREVDFKNSGSQEDLLMISEIFEGIVIAESEQNEWLGSKATVTSASRYDDVFNGVDAVCEFRSDEDENKFLALGIDVTFGNADSDTLDKKFSKIEKMIKSGEMTNLKYFKDSEGRNKSMYAPKVVVGADTNTVKELFDLWDKKKNKELAAHPYQCGMVLTIQYQLYHFYKLAMDYGHENIAESYRNALEQVNDLVEEKKDMYNSMLEDSMKDTVVKRLWDKVRPKE